MSAVSTFVTDRYHGHALRVAYSLFLACLPNFVLKTSPGPQDGAPHQQQGCGYEVEDCYSTRCVTQAPEYKDFDGSAFTATVARRQGYWWDFRTVMQTGRLVALGQIHALVREALCRGLKRAPALKCDDKAMTSQELATTLLDMTHAVLILMSLRRVSPSQRDPFSAAHDAEMWIQRCSALYDYATTLDCQRLSDLALLFPWEQSQPDALSIHQRRLGAILTGYDMLFMFSPMWEHQKEKNTFIYLARLHMRYPTLSGYMTSRIPIVIDSDEEPLAQAQAPTPVVLTPVVPTPVVPILVVPILVPPTPVVPTPITPTPVALIPPSPLQLPAPTSISTSPKRNTFSAVVQGAYQASSKRRRIQPKLVHGPTSTVTAALRSSSRNSDTARHQQRPARVPSTTRRRRAIMGGRKPTMPFSILLLIHEDVGEQLEPLWTARDGGPLACEAEWATESSPLAFLEGLIKEIRAQSAQCREHLKDINIFLGCYECRRDGMPLMIGPIPAISPWSLRFDLVCLRGAGTRGDHDWETRYGKAPTRGLRHWVPLRANVLNTEQSGTTLSVIASDESGAHDVGQLTHRSLLLVEQTEKKKNKEGRGKKAPEEAYDTLVLGGKPIHGPDQRVAQTIYMEEYLSDIAAQVTATSSTASTSLTTTDEEGSEQGRYSANYTVQDGAVITTGAVIQTIEQYCRKGGLLMLDWGTLYLRDIDQQCLPLVPWYPYLELPFIQPLMMSSQLQDDHVDGFCRTIIPSGVLLSTKGGK